MSECPKTPSEMVKLFHDDFTVPMGRIDDIIDARIALLKEEYEELVEALEAAKFSDKRDVWEHVAKEAADLAYVTYGMAEVLDIDLDESIRRVHTSNMSKMPRNGVPVIRADGKILKPPTYVEADMTGVT